MTIMKKKIFLAGLIFLAGMAWSSSHRVKVEASVSASCGGKDCPSFENWCGGTFPFPLPPDFPFPSLKPCPKPTSSPTPTPTLSPEVTPTPTTPPGEQPTPTPTQPSTGGEPSGGGAPSGGGGGVGGATPFSCGAATPQGAPTLTSLSPAGTGQMTLSWTAVSGVTNYALSYGLTPGNYLYGVTNTGNTTSFTVGELDPGKNYCFAVLGVNDCASGPLSNERCSGAAILGAAAEGQVLGLSSTGSSKVEYLRYIVGILWLWLGLKFFLIFKKG